MAGAGHQADTCRFSGRLRPAERAVVRAAARGEVVDLGDGRCGQGAEVRAGLLVALLLGAKGPVHPRGVEVVGARVRGRLDLTGAGVPHRFALRACCFDEPVALESATTRDVSLSGSELPGLRATHATIEGGLDLAEVVTTGPIVLAGATVRHQLDLAGATLDPGDGDDLTLDAERAEVGGSVLLSGRDRPRFTAEGRVCLDGATIGGDLDLAGARISHPAGVALSAAWATVAGSVLMYRSRSRGRSEPHGCEVRGMTNLYGARVGGALDLSGSELENATADRRPHEDRPLHVALEASLARIDGGVFLTPNHDRPFRAVGQVRLVRAQVGGGFELVGAQLAGDREQALVAEGITVTGNATARFPDGAESARALTCHGGIELGGARITGRLDLSGAQLHNAGGDALNLDEAEVGGALLLEPVGDRPFAATGRVSVQGARLGSAVSAVGASLAAGNPPEAGRTAGDLREALCLDHTTVEGSVHLTLTGGHRFTSRGKVRILGATVGAELVLQGADLEADASEEVALELDGTRVGGSIFLSTAHTHRFTATGGARLVGCHVGGYVDLRGAELRHEGEVALDARRIEVDDDLLLGPDAHGHRFTVFGAVVFDGSRVGGRVDAAAALLDHPSGAALSLAGASVRGDAHLSVADTRDGAPPERFHVRGQLRLNSAHVHGHLVLAGAHLENGEGVALDGQSLAVDLDASFARAGQDEHGWSFRAAGTVVLDGARVGGTLDLDDAVLIGPEPGRGPDGRPRRGEALSVVAARVGGPLGFKRATVDGGLSAHGASAGDLDDHRGDVWESPAPLRLEGFDYQGLAYDDVQQVKHRVDVMLSRSEPFSIQPYTHLAAVYREKGNRTAAREVIWHMHWAEHHATSPPDNVLTRTTAWQRLFPNQKAGRPVGTDDRDRRAPWPTRLGRRIIGHTVGFGYRFLRPLVAAVVLFAVGVGVFTVAAHRDGFTPAEPVESAEVTSSACTSEYPCVQPLVYSLDVLLPVIDLRQDSFWVPNADVESGRWAAGASLIMALLGWAIVGVTLTGAAERLRDPT